MLNEENVHEGTASSKGEDMSMYSLVSEANQDADASNAETEPGNQPKNIPDEGAENKISAANLGLLILEGLEADDDDDESEEEEEVCKRGKASDVLSVPESVYLPSEVGSMTVSGVTHDQNKFKVKDGENGNHFREILKEKWSLLLSCVHRWKASLAERSFNALQLIPVFLMVVAMLSFASWRSYAWKSEALRLREQAQKRNAVLPLTLSLLKERESLIERLKEFEDVAGRKRYGDFFPHHESDDESFLSFKNCYVEASISLGRCSKEWHRWWSPSDGRSKHDDHKDDSEEYSSYDDGFTDDMSKLMKGFKDTVASKTTRSYSYIQKALKEVSYDGMKDSFITDGYINSIVHSAPQIESNDTGNTRIAEI